jgi:AcrR family transcriptional regulator
LSAAADTFYRRGITPVSMDEIADAAHVSKPTLYSHFQSKDEVVAEALDFVDDMHFDWFVNQVDKFAAEYGTPPAIAVFDVLTKWFTSESFHGCTFINSSIEVRDRNPSAQQAVLRHKSRTRAWLRELCAQSGVAGEAITGRADLLMILMEGAIITASVEKDLEAGKKARAAAQAVLADGAGTALSVARDDRE